MLRKLGDRFTVYESTRDASLYSTNMARFNNNNLLVVWRIFTSGLYGCILSPLGTPLTSVFQITDDTRDDIYSKIKITVLDNDNFVVAWGLESPPQPERQLVYKLFNAMGTSLTNDLILINTNTSYDIDVVQVMDIVNLYNHQFAALWRNGYVNQTIPSYRIEGQLITYDGVKLDNLFLSTAGTDAQIVALRDNTFLVSTGGMLQKFNSTTGEAIDSVALDVPMITSRQNKVVGSKPIYSVSNNAQRLSMVNGITLSSDDIHNFTGFVQNFGDRYNGLNFPILLDDTHFMLVVTKELFADYPYHYVTETYGRVINYNNLTVSTECQLIYPTSIDEYILSSTISLSEPDNYSNITLIWSTNINVDCYNCLPSIYGQRYTFTAGSVTTPTLINNNFVITAGGSLRLTPANLNATNEDNTPENIIYKITDLQGGCFDFQASTDCDSSILFSFTQQQVNEGQVVLTAGDDPVNCQDNSHGEPSFTISFSISVSDGGCSSTTPISANVNLTCSTFSSASALMLPWLSPARWISAVKTPLQALTARVFASATMTAEPLLTAEQEATQQDVFVTEQLVKLTGPENLAIAASNEGRWLKSSSASAETTTASASSIAPMVPDLASTLLLGRTLWQMGKQTYTTLQGAWSSATQEAKPRLQSKQQKVLLAQLDALKTRVRPYQKAVYAEDHLQWRLDDVREDIVYHQDTFAALQAELENLEREIIKLEKQNVSTTSQVSTSASYFLGTVSNTLRGLSGSWPSLAELAGRKLPTPTNLNCQEIPIKLVVTSTKS